MFRAARSYRRGADRLGLGVISGHFLRPSFHGRRHYALAPPLIKFFFSEDRDKMVTKM